MPDDPASTTPLPVDAARIIEQVLDYAIITLDGSGGVVSWNAGAERLDGYPPDEAIGQNFSMLYSEEDRRFGLPLQLLDQARRDGRVEHQGRRVRKDGTEFWADVVIAALHDDDDSITGFVKVTRDVTAQHELEVSVRRSEERFRLLVSQVRDYAIIALDASGTIESWNAGAERVKGYTADEAIGQNFSMFYTAEDRRTGLPLELLDRARQEGSVEITGWRVRKDGTKFWGDVIITALRDESGNLSGFAKVTRDLTERKQLEDAQASFLASIAHDFRTPITAMKGYTELMRDAPEGLREEFLERIDVNADRLMQMMKDLVGYATLHSVTTSYRPEMIDLTELVRETVSAMGSTLEVDRVALPKDVSMALADRGSMERVITNLVANALKYSADGPVVVDITRTDDRVRITVTDEGRGIAPEDLDTIFDEFERGRLAEDDGGTGLGLTSVKRLVEEQGGRVDIASMLGQGTMVTVELPAPARGMATA